MQWQQSQLTIWTANGFMITENLAATVDRKFRLDRPRDELPDLPPLYFATLQDAQEHAEELLEEREPESPEVIARKLLHAMAQPH